MLQFASESYDLRHTYGTCTILHNAMIRHNVVYYTMRCYTPYCLGSVNAAARARWPEAYVQEWYADREH